MAASEVFQNNPATTVSSGGTDAGTIGTIETWTVTSSLSFPSAVTGVTKFHVGDPAVPSELILVTNGGGTVGNTWTVTRGAENTTPVAHTAGFTIAQVVAAGWLGSLTPNPMTTFGDMIYGGTSPTAGATTRLAGGTVASKRFLVQTGTGSASAAPQWGTIAVADVPTLNQNTTGSAGSAATAGSAITAGTAITVSGTVSTAHGGTGLGSLTTYAVITGGTSSTSPVQQVATAGTVGQVLTSNGPGTLPTWQNATGGTGGTVTFPITVTEGGTGGTQATAYSIVTGGTSATAPFQQVASVGGSGQVLVSQGAGQLPQWVANTGGSVTFPITVGEGGTGGTAVTAYSVVTGGTTATDAFQAVTSGAGSIGFVLTSTGTNSLPSWQHPTGGTGISNPMSAVGDMIVGGAGSPAVATRLSNPATSGLILTSNGTGFEPTWQPPPVDWINVQDPAYGATGNGTNSLSTTGATPGSGDGAVTASSKTFTSQSLAPFAGSRDIWIPGAGATGTTLHTTITCSVPGTGTLTVAATTTVSGVVATWGTDDTAAIKAAIAAAAENVNPANPIGLTVYFPAGIYLVSSPLILPPGVQLLGSGRTLAYYGGSQPFPLSSPVLKPVTGFTHTLINGGTIGNTGGGTITGVIGMISQNLGAYQTQSGNQTVRYITIDGRLITPGSAFNGIEAWGPVWGVKIEDVGIFGMPQYGIYTSHNANVDTKYPDFWQVIGLHIAACHSDGFNTTSWSDSYIVASESTGNAGNGWTITGADNVKIAASKAEYNNGVGLAIGRGGAGRPILVNGFGSDGNYTYGIQVTGNGYGPVDINGCGLNFDGQNNGAGGNFAGLSVTGGGHVTVSGLQVTSGTSPTTGGTFPTNGIQVPSTFTGVLQLDNCEIYAGGTAISVDPAATGTVVTGTNVLTGIGNWSAQTVSQVWQPAAGPGGGFGGAQPSNHGLVAWTFDPALAGNHFTYTSGTQYLCSVYISQATSINHIYWAVGATATTITSGNNYVGLYSAGGALMGSTATTTIDSTMATNGLKTATLTAAVPVTPGQYWVALLFNYSGAASLGIEGGGNGIAAVTNAGLSSPAAYRYAIPSGGTGRTTLLSSFNPASNALSAPSWWAAVDV